MNRIIHEQFEIDENNVLIKYHEKDGVKKVVIPEGVTEIGESAFCNCDLLKSVNISNSVTEIGADTFFGCESLTEITIPDSVTEIGEGAFRWCKNLKNVIMLNSMTKISVEMFKGCKNLMNITFPNDIKIIEKYAFENCQGLIEIKIPDGVIEIGFAAFCNCDLLKSVNISNSVTKIGNFAFYHCKNLNDITIPNSVTEICESAFKDCNNIETINIFSYKVFSLLGNDLKVIALNTIIKNKTKFSEEDVNKFGKYIVENKIEILKTIIQNNHLMYLLRFLLNELYMLYTKEEINEILNEMISKGQNNPEITTRLLNYTNNYQTNTNIKSIIDNEFDLSDFGDEDYKNTK